MWMVLKERAVGNEHWTPIEAFQRAFPAETAVRPEELSVFCWVLPHTRATKQDNARENFLPARSWAISRHPGEWFINVPMRDVLVNALNAKGIQAVGPYLLPGSQVNNTSPFGNASCWSERHAAFIAGMGTFGLSDGLITRLGKAVRFGSVVLRYKLEPDPRPYGDNHRAYCLYFKDGSCQECAKRCPVDSVRTIERGGRNKQPCLVHQIPGSFAHIEGLLGGPAFRNLHACGLCQVAVPCESRIPPGITV